MSLRDIPLIHPDPMMEELQAIRDELGAYMLSLSSDECVRWANSETEVIAQRHGYELRPHPTIPNCDQFVRKT